MRVEPPLAITVERSCRLWLTLAVSTLLLVAGPAYSSVERRLEVATETTCEELLFDATTLYGSIADIEYELSFAIEARISAHDRMSGVARDQELLAELNSLNLRIARVVAMHRLFQKPKCPIEKDWYSYKSIRKLRVDLWN